MWRFLRCLKKNIVIEIKRECKKLIFYIPLFSHIAWSVAIADKLSPRMVRKLPRRAISSGLKFFEIIHESVLAKVTNSQPEGGVQEFIISPNILYFPGGKICSKKIF